MGHIHISSHAPWPEKHWTHFPVHHDTLLRRPRSHHVGLSRKPHCMVAEANTTHRWPMTSLPTMSQIRNLLEPFQVCFLCLNRTSTRIHHVTQRNDCWSLESPNEFPSNVTPLSDNVTNCIIVFFLFCFTCFSKVSLMYCFLSLLQMDYTSNQYMGFADGARRWSSNIASDG